MAKKTQSAAEAYRALRRQNAQKEATHVVTLPSGFPFKLKTVDVRAYVRAGRLPDSLLKRGMDGWKNLAELAAKNPDALSEKDARDAVSTLVFMREVVQEACVNPRLVVGGEGADELDPKELSEDDFNYIFAWATNQISEKGGATESLNNFRQ